MKNCKSAIIGTGNKLMGDEGVGIHAIEYLRSAPSPLPPCLAGRRVSHRRRGNKVKVDLVDGGTGGIALLHIFEKYDRVIIIDAADFGGKPGEVRAFDIEGTSKNLLRLQFCPFGCDCVRFLKKIVNVAHGYVSGFFAHLPCLARRDQNFASKEVFRGALDSQQIIIKPDSNQVSLHSVSLAGIITLAKKLDLKLPKITIIAVQPEKIAPQMELSSECKSSIMTIEKILKEII